MANKPQNVFHVKLEEKAVTGTPGILDQFSLPPAVVTFMQKNQRKIWTAVSVVAAVVVAAALYESYRSYILNKTAEAYDQALLLEDAQKKTAALQKIAEDYGTAPAGVWSRIALAHLDQEAGKSKEAIAKLTAIDAKDDALKSLLLVNLGGLHEQEKQFDQAEKIYLQLKTVKGFEAIALSSLGRVYEALGRKDQAVQMYQQYMGLTEIGKGKKEGDAAFPEQEIVQASLNRLLK